MTIDLILSSSVSNSSWLPRLISISLGTVWGYRLKRCRLFGHVCSDCLIRPVCGRCCCCCSFLSAWSQVFNTPAKSTPPMNQIKLTCSLSLKLCNPGFELNQVTEGGKGKGLNMTFQSEGSWQNWPALCLLPQKWLIVWDLWECWVCVCVFFTSLASKVKKCLMKLKSVRWSDSDICLFSPSVVSPLDAAYCLDVGDASCRFLLPANQIAVCCILACHL